jgi:hypothetical protein
MILATTSADDSSGTEHLTGSAKRAPARFDESGGPQRALQSARMANSVIQEP